MAQPEPRTCYRHPDRETGLSCSECGRSICYECMTPAAVGLRCPDHSGKPQGLQRVTTTARRATHDAVGGYVTRALVAINVGIYLLQLLTGAGIYSDRGRIFEEGALFGPLVAQGDWWRLMSAAFLHFGPIHLGMNMLALWWFGQALELALGRVRFLLLYLVSGLAGSAGALLLTPLAFTVGASGAIFGMLGAALILERRGNMVFGGQALTLIVVNVVFTFAVAGLSLGTGAVGISIGGHLGGLAGGALCILALDRFRREQAAAVAAMLGVAVLSVALAYWKVRGYA